MSHTISDRKRVRWAAELDGRNANAFPGMTAHVRGYRPDEIVEIARKLAGIVSEDKIAHLLPETACLCVRALLSLAAKPSYDELLRALCAAPKCQADRCFDCKMKANGIMRLYEAPKGVE